jgi:hypothetical protein
MATKRTPAKKPTAKKPTKKTAPGRAPAKRAATNPYAAPGSPAKYRVRVRMYRQGLGDCFLVTFPRKRRAPFHMLIDCGALARDTKAMKRIVEHIHGTVQDGKKGKARLDVVVATHEHKDHLSGFNQARDLFDTIDFGAVWLGWTENLTRPEIKMIKEAKKKAVSRLRATLSHPLAAALDGGAAALLAFSEDDVSGAPGARTIAEALDYLKFRGRKAENLEYLEPGTGPLALDGVDGVRAYILGPPRDPILLKGSEVTKQLKKDGMIYHLAMTGEAGMDALAAAIPEAAVSLEIDSDRFHPFAAEHRIAEKVSDPLCPGNCKPNPYYESIRAFVDETYRSPTQEWRRIDHDWLNAFGQLALDLDSDTNNTSLVLAFELVKTKEVLLFVGDAQVGNWRSWANVEFKVPGREKPLPAHDLLCRTVFYKVGHHCSHNATIKAGGLELMTRDGLVAFIPLDRETARQQGKKDPVTGLPKGWDMPAPPLYKALRERTQNRVVISDVQEQLTPEAQKANVFATDTFIDYFLE